MIMWKKFGYAWALLGSLLLAPVVNARAGPESFVRFANTMGNWEDDIDDDEVTRAILSLPTHYAFNVFYMQSGGNDQNAGSTTNNAALVTDVGGTYNQGTGAGGNDRYTASSGTPFSGTGVNEWVSIFTAGAGQATFVGQITAVNGGGSSIDVSLTAIYGTRPANASTKTAKTGGAWASLNAPGNAGLGAVTAIPASTQINIQTSTYANTSNNKTMTLVGSGANCLWYRGYNSTLGDLDNVPVTTRTPGTNMPLFTWTTGHLIQNGAQSLWSGLAFSMSSTGAAAVIVAGGANSRYHRCRFQNTQATATCSAVNMTGGNSRFDGCWMSSTTTATGCILASTTGEYYNCTIEGGVSSFVWTVGSLAVDQCICSGMTTQAIIGTVFGVLSCNGTTFSGRAGTAVDGIKVTTQVTEAQIINCVFDTFSGNGINNATGTATNLWNITSNSYYACGGQITGFGDNPQWDAITETNDPFLSAATKDFTLLPSALSYQKAAPQLFENANTNVPITFASRGAVDPNVGQPFPVGGGVFFEEEVVPY